MHNQRRLSQKILATILIFCLLFSDFAGLGITLMVYASDNQVNANENIKFDVALSTETTKNQKELAVEISDETLTINASVGVKEKGYLKSPVLEIENLENQMFKIKGEINTGEYIQSFKENKIYLSQINNDIEIEVKIPIEYKKSSEIDRKSVV